MKKLLFLVAVIFFAACQKEEVENYDLKASTLYIVFNNGDPVMQFEAYNYSGIKLVNNVLTFVPNPNCPGSIVYSKAFEFKNVVSYSIRNEYTFPCR